MGEGSELALGTQEERVVVKGARAIASATTGLSALPAGAWYLFGHRNLWPFAAAPLIVNLLLYVFLGGLAVAYVLPVLVGWLTPTTFPWWLSWVEPVLRPFLGWLVWLLSLLLLAVVGALSFTAVGSVIAAPFLDLLSEKVENLELGRSLGRPFSLGALMEDATRTVVQACLKLTVVATLFVATLPLLIVPVIGGVAVTVINSYFAIWYLAAEFLDLPMSRAGWSLTQRRAWLQRRRGAVFGFGAAVYLVCMVPLMGFLVLPVAAVSGTRLFVTLCDPSELPAPSEPPVPSGLPATGEPGS